MEKDEETISLTRQKKQSAAFTKQPAVLAALQRCACSSISRGTIRKLGGGKIKGNVETNLPSFDLSRLSFSSTSCTPFLSLLCLLFWISILVDGDDVTSTDEIFTPRLWRKGEGEVKGICHPSGFKQARKT